MLFWLERRSTHTAVSIPAAVPAMRGLRCTGLPLESSLTLRLGVLQAQLDRQEGAAGQGRFLAPRATELALIVGARSELLRVGQEIGDRKSTRLNSSHVRISYAVFCLKKKKYNPCHLIS